ncbi:uncharacterized protein BDCG_16654 [Blastomyces dermatitidis ER-3]|uniref:Uncharacterized protein n=1 Tax=Ajellomyces dermatitidis (strain ER-3 / ATCC MYA-2586) TaxID=559297 RepID=A0ABX2VTL5_AJEDR|nr:uncharacterized protein BDCG_16654 [Blastomyces dermatitidis ER-3]OAT00529.1 hypothetical protein BDCG_16654 [Blastomyces dermatitidis ER-3]
MSRRSTALIVTPSPASLTAVVVVAMPCSEMSFLLLAGASVSVLFSAPLTAVVTPPPPSANTVISSPAAHLSPAQNTAELSLQSPVISSSSLCEEALVQSLTDTTTYLHCVK